MEQASLHPKVDEITDLGAAGVVVEYHIRGVEPGGGATRFVFRYRNGTGRRRHCSSRGDWRKELKISRLRVVVCFKNPPNWVEPGALGVGENGVAETAGRSSKRLPKRQESAAGARRGNCRQERKSCTAARGESVESVDRRP
jgi:hypothetical protein